MEGALHGSGGANFLIDRFWGAALEVRTVRTYPMDLHLLIVLARNVLFGFRGLDLDIVSWFLLYVFSLDRRAVPTGRETLSSTRLYHCSSVPPM